MSTLNIALAGLWVATIAQGAFVLVYGFGAKWYRHFVGRALFIKSATLAVTLGVTLVNSYVIYPHQMEVGATLMWGIALAIVYQLSALLRQRFSDRRSDGSG